MGIIVRFPKMLVAKTFAPTVEVEVVMAGSLSQCAFFTEQKHLRRQRPGAAVLFSFVVEFTENLEPYAAKRAGKRQS